MQIQPSKQLSKLVKHYLFIESNTRGDKKFQLFSDGNNGIVFSFKNRLSTNVYNSSKLYSLPHAFLYGHISTFRNVFSTGDIKLLIVVFHPYTANQLLGIPANNLTDEIIELKDLFGSESDDLTDKLFECQTAYNQINLIESFLLKIFSKNQYAIQPMIMTSIELIQQNHGLISLEQLVNLTGYSKSGIERKFMESIGMHPKTYSNIVKLNIYLKILRDEQDVKIIRAAYDAGYYDHSHAFKFFKRITGITPSQYAQKLNPLALNLLEYPNLNS